VARPSSRRRGVATRRPVAVAEVIRVLVEHGVDFVVIGGLAAIAHGSQRLTQDLDIVIDRRVANCRRLIAALVELEAEYRSSSGRWVRLSSKADPKWVAKENHLFDTRAGGIDIFNKLDGVPTWKEARPRAIEVEAFGNRFPVLDKDTLIRSKLAAGREKDLADVAELNQAE
jgi:predicted nucleotidyltransferase